MLLSSSKRGILQCSKVRSKVEVKVKVEVEGVVCTSRVQGAQSLELSARKRNILILSLK
jgi:hypothetical protein